MTIKTCYPRKSPAISLSETAMFSCVISVLTCIHMCMCMQVHIFIQVHACKVGMCVQLHRCAGTCLCRSVCAKVCMCVKVHRCEGTYVVQVHVCEGVYMCAVA